MSRQSYFNPKTVNQRSPKINFFFRLSFSARNSVPIGVEDGKIPNGYVTSSSTYNRYHAPWLGRLNKKARGRNKGAWSAKKNDRRQWLQFNMGSPTLITTIRTQGRQDANQWVTSYKVYFGNDGVRFIPYKKGGRVKVSLSTQLKLFTAVTLWQNLAVLVSFQ